MPAQSFLGVSGELSPSEDWENGSFYLNVECLKPIIPNKLKLESRSKPQSRSLEAIWGLGEGYGQGQWEPIEQGLQSCCGDLERPYILGALEHRKKLISHDMGQTFSPQMSSYYLLRRSFVL